MLDVCLKTGIYFLLVLAVVKPLGVYMTKVFSKEKTFLDPVLLPLERLLHRVGGIDASREQGFVAYTGAMMVFNVVSLVVLYAMERLQHLLPLNPDKMPAVPPALAWNTAVSFTTNTNWQAYSGESTMSLFTQMAGLAVHNFASAATGIAIAIAFVRGVARTESKGIGNFWFDLVRSILWVLLPISLLAAVVLMSQGVIQNFKPSVAVTTLEGATQKIPQGPIASQEAIKELGTNGGGFFNANSAHPYENPTPFSNLVEMFLIFSIGGGLTYTLGAMTGKTRHGWAVFWSMASLFLAGALIAGYFEVRGNPDPSRSRRVARDGKHGGQGSPVRACRLRPVRHDHHRRLLRRRQLDARLLHAAGRPRPAPEHPARRDHLRRRRRRPLRDASLRRPLGLHRRPHGRADARVPRQEDRGEGSEARDALGAHPDLLASSSEPPSGSRRRRASPA